MQLTLQENKRLIEQQVIDNVQGIIQRNKMGQYATPPELTHEIANCVFRIWRKSRIQGGVRFLEPALGTGAFFSALLSKFPNHLIEDAYGIEYNKQISETAASLWAGSGLKVQTADFTKIIPSDQHGSFNLLLTNPPYVRHHHLLSSEKVRLQKLVKSELDIKISGLAGLYCYFMLLSHKWLSDGGIGAWLVPSECLEVNYGVAIRDYLTTNVQLLKIHRYCPTDLQFSDALTTSMVIIYRKRKPRRNHKVSFTFGGCINHPQKEQRVELASLKANDKWNVFFKSPKRSVSDSEIFLGDYFKIKRGIATGANNFFIMPLAKAKSLGISREYYKPILPSPRFLKETTIESDRYGFPKLPNKLIVIDSNDSEEIIHARCPALWSYLQEGIKNGIDKRYLTSKRKLWYSQEKRLYAPFLCTYMGRNDQTPFRLIWNKSKAIAPNVYLLLYPKENLSEQLDKNPQLMKEVFALLQELDTKRFRDKGRVYGGGLYKMEPKELATVNVATAWKKLELDL